jgi:hypothetical protein
MTFEHTLDSQKEPQVMWWDLENMVVGWKLGFGCSPETAALQRAVTQQIVMVQNHIVSPLSNLSCWTTSQTPQDLLHKELNLPALHGQTCDTPHRSYQKKWLVWPSRSQLIPFLMWWCVTLGRLALHPMTVGKDLNLNRTDLFLH